MIVKIIGQVEKAAKKDKIYEMNMERATRSSWRSESSKTFRSDLCSER
jgi:hypothetical protein